MNKKLTINTKFHRVFKHKYLITTKICKPLFNEHLKLCTLMPSNNNICTWHNSRCNTFQLKYQAEALTNKNYCCHLCSTFFAKCVILSITASIKHSYITYKYSNICTDLDHCSQFDNILIIISKEAFCSRNLSH